MFETDSIPKNWVTKCNQADQIWTPSTFNKSTFAKSGVDESKIRIIPPYPKNYRLKTSKRYAHKDLRKFNFLCIGTFDDRKGWRELIKAYCNVFSKSDDVCLIAKADLRDRVSRDQAKDMINSWRTSDANIIWIFDLLNDEKIINLYNTADVYVSPSRGEGWNMPAFEFMEMGKPVIANKWSAHLDFINEDNGYLAEIEGLEKAGSAKTSYIGKDHFLYAKDNMKWAVISIKNISRQLDMAYKNENLRLAKGMNAKETLSNYGRDRFSRDIIGLIDEAI